MSIPDVEKIAAGYLREHGDIEAFGARVVSKTPSSTVDPWIRYTQLDVRNETNSRTERLLTYWLSFDCYAGSDGGLPEASDLARTARSVLHAMPEETFDDVVVTQVTFTGMARIPDVEADDPARERFVLDTRIRVHEV